jgi:N12 class adenine-specific DNA methylase
MACLLASLTVLKAATTSSEVDLSRIRHHLECQLEQIIEQLLEVEFALKDGGVL